MAVCYCTFHELQHQFIKKRGGKKRKTWRLSCCSSRCRQEQRHGDWARGNRCWLLNVLSVSRGMTAMYWPLWLLAHYPEPECRCSSQSCFYEWNASCNGRRLIQCMYNKRQVWSIEVQQFPVSQQLIHSPLTRSALPARLYLKASADIWLRSSRWRFLKSAVLRHHHGSWLRCVWAGGGMWVACVMGG